MRDQKKLILVQGGNVYVISSIFLKWSRLSDDIFVQRFYPSRVRKKLILVQTYM